MLVVGLTGNFGMGKSSVLSMFRELGAVTLDTDRIVGILLKEGPVVSRIRELLGREVVDVEGRLDKKLVANKIFHNPQLRRLLEAYVHPLVMARVDEFIENMHEREKIVIVEVPLLFEGDHEERFQKIITVYTPEETAIERLMASGMKRSDALARLKAQLPIGAKIERADYTIDNGGAEDWTRKQVETVYRSLVEEIKRG